MSRYEQHIIRKPGVRGKKGEVVMPDQINTRGKPDTGPLIWWGKEFAKDATTVLESGIISGDCEVGTGRAGSFAPHKQSRGEFFMFIGTNPDDPMDLGAEAEFYLGEGPTLEKITINRSTNVYVPPGVGHFPLFWKNVKRPVIFIVVAADTTGMQSSPISMEGRP